MAEILIFVLFLDMVLVYEIIIEVQVLKKISVMTSPHTTMPSCDGFKDCHVILNVILYIILLGQMPHHIVADDATELEKQLMSS